MNRRGIIGLIAGVPFAGKAIAESAVGGLVGAGAQPFPPSQGYGGMEQSAANSLTPPRIERDSALRMIFSDKNAMEEIRAELFEEHRSVHSIDPDIMIMRSWSPMAKIAFQRQRNVDRAIEEAFSAGGWNKPSRYIHAIGMRLDKLMWGRS